MSEFFNKNKIFISIIIAALIIGFSIIISNQNNQPAKTNQQNSNTETSQKLESFYTKSIANIRECSSTSCEIVGKYPVNKELKLPYKSVEEMPEWVGISWTGGMGYINKIVLSQEPVVIEKIIEKAPSAKQVTLSDVIQYWRPRVAYIECVWTFFDPEKRDVRSGGSGLVGKYSNISDDIFIYTNKHVVTREDFTPVLPPTKCLIKFPDIANIYSINDDKDVFISNKGLDYGALRVRNPDSILKNLSKDELYICNYKAPLGEPLIILGYPAIGSTEDITVTEGIISGYDGDYYVTSAKIEHGNSGGVAVSLKYNCSLGIPTYVVPGSLESLARILNLQNILGALK